MLAHSSHCITPTWTKTVKFLPKLTSQSRGWREASKGSQSNPGYSSEVQGVFNIAGALQTTDFLTSGDNERLFSIHGTEDGTVPYGEGMISLLGFNIIDVDGSSVIHSKPRNWD